MAAEQSKPKGPDLARGVPLGDVADGGMVGGHVDDDAVLLARRGERLLPFGVDTVFLVFGLFGVIGAVTAYLGVTESRLKILEDISP